MRIFAQDRYGLAMIEFALLMPLLVGLLLGVVEISRFVHMNHKVGNATATMSDLVNRNLRVSKQGIQTILSTFPDMISPYDSDGYTVIVSAVTQRQAGVPPLADWQERIGSTEVSSRLVNDETREVELPGVVLDVKEQALLVEVSVTYRPIFAPDSVRGMVGLDEQGVYKRTVMRPRFGSFQFAPE